jgi:hypothetical protein
VTTICLWQKHRCPFVQGALLHLFMGQVLGMQSSVLQEPSEITRPNPASPSGRCDSHEAEEWGGQWGGDRLWGQQPEEVLGGLRTSPSGENQVCHLVGVTVETGGQTRPQKGVLSLPLGPGEQLVLLVRSISADRLFTQGDQLLQWLLAIPAPW